MSERVEVKSLAEALFRVGAIRFGSFTLSSGRRSSYYVDLRLAPSHPGVYSLVLAAYADMLSRIEEPNFDAIAGVATAGVTISSPLAVRLGKPMLYVRSDGKDHGLGRMVEGEVAQGSRVVVVDDVVTSGGSISAAIAALRQTGYVVRDSLVLVDRLEGGFENLKAVGVKLTSFTNIGELAKSLHESGLLPKSDADAFLRRDSHAPNILERGTSSR
jgi:orotate phosphoribosyltransferase